MAAGTHEGVTLREQERYLLYLVGYNLVRNGEVFKKMLDKINPNSDHNFDNLIIDSISDRRGDERVVYFQEFSKRFLKTDSSMVVAQTALQASSPTEAAQKMLQVDSPLGLAQKALQGYSPEEAALNFIQNEEQVNRLLELIRQRNREAG